MTAKSKFREPRTQKSAQSNKIEESIRRRAFELYEQRGREDGFALDDWLKAEREIQREILEAQEHRKAKAAKGSRC